MDTWVAEAVAEALVRRQPAVCGKRNRPTPPTDQKTDRVTRGRPGQAARGPAPAGTGGGNRSLGSCVRRAGTEEQKTRSQCAVEKESKFQTF